MRALSIVLAVVLGVGGLTFTNPASAQDTDECPSSIQELGLHSDPSVWRIPMDSVAFYMPELTWEKVTTFDGSRFFNCREGNVELTVPRVTNAGAGVGYLVLSEYFICSKRATACEFRFAGKNYDFSKKSVVNKFRCSKKADVRAMPSAASKFISAADTQQWSAYVGNVTFPWAEKNSLCLPIPDAPGSYALASLEIVPPTKPKNPTYETFRCRYSKGANTWYCGYETVDTNTWSYCLVTGDCGMLGVDTSHNRIVYVNQDSVSIRKK